ncbi:hypothetical protein ACHWQZ_G007282 [Mnemiopsis leidyi]
MRVLILLVVYVLTGVRADGFSPKDKSVREAYREWSGRYVAGKEGELRTGDLQRFKIFESNFRYVKKMSGNKMGFEMELNMFADKSEQELESYVGVNMTEMFSLTVAGPSPPLLSSTPVPLSKDHRRETGLTPPRAIDHTHCGGGSWAHSVVAVLESRYKTLTDEMVLFSEQELLDCSYTDGRDSCCGGYMTAGFQYVLDKDRIADKRHYPTYGSTGTCHSQHFPNALSRARVTEYRRLPEGEDNLMREVSVSGPVSVGIRADRSLYFYRSGLYDPTQCWSGDINHAVTAVGYQPDRWIIKNCWGTSWGSLNGFAYLSRKYENVCKISNFPVTVSMSLRESSDPDNWCPHVPKPDREPCWSATDYTGVWNKVYCEYNNCCWDADNQECYVKAKITLYEKRNFEGVSATFYGSIPDLEPYGITRVAHSIRVHYGNFMAYTNVNYGESGGSWENLSLGVLEGGHGYDNLDDFSFSHSISSIRALSSSKHVITLFTHTHARGAARAILKQDYWVGGDWNDKFSSAFTKGKWRLCDHTSYKGDCETVYSGITRSFSKVNDKISSVLEVN